MYAPMSSWLKQAWPDLVHTIYMNGNLAVQPFLVIGGFLAVQSLSRRHTGVASLVWQRYLRLAPTLILALLLVLVFTRWLEVDLYQQSWVSPLPSTGEFLAHVLLLQDVLGVPSISAGAWYVAIDFQLYTCMVLLAAATGQRPASWGQSLAPMWMALAVMASATVFSRHEDLDAWAIYFLAAYGLGALAAWAKQDRNARKWLGLSVLVLVLDAWIDPRPKVLVAMVTAGSLYLWSHMRWATGTGVVRRSIDFLSQASYGIFVSHFAVIILSTALWQHFGLRGTVNAMLYLMVTWATCLATGLGLQALAERLVQALRLLSPRP